MKPGADPRILVTGGAGYIGSACVYYFLSNGAHVTVIDNLSRGDRKYLPEKIELHPIDLLDRNAVIEFFTDNRFDVVVHLAAHKDAGASMEEGVRYSENIRMTLNLLDGMVHGGVKRIIFSSTAAVYGEPEYNPIDEKHPVNPMNYYGYTKKASEEMISWYEKIYSIRSVIFRYFNVAGDSGLYYRESGAKNLFPVILEVLEGERKALEIFGSDYPTHDGTGIRDYVHISDIAKAHWLGIARPNVSGVFNIGSRSGYSVREVVNAFEKLSQKKIPVIDKGRRPGDPANVIAGYDEAKKELGWEPSFNLNEIVKSLIAMSRAV